MGDHRGVVPEMRQEVSSTSAYSIRNDLFSAFSSFVQYEQDVAHPDSYSQTSLPGDDTYYDTRRLYLTSEPRGTTPPVEVDRVLLRPDTIALGFEDRLEEYEALLARGATRLMCETFTLEFSHELGILLEMDEELMAEWANEDMRRFGPRWKVCLGREIHLDPKDVDGSTYIEEHLEEALLFGKRTEGGLRWESVSSGLGFMLTRPVKNSNDTDDGMNSETEMDMEYPEEITRNEYEEPSDDSECDSEIDADDRQMQASVDETWQADADIIMQDTTSDISDSSSSASSEYDFEDDDEDEGTTAGTDAIQAAV